MAFDGVTIAALVKELNDTLTGGRIVKIAQPEPDALLFTIKVSSASPPHDNAVPYDNTIPHGNAQRRLLMSADASLPLLYLTDNNLPSPMTAPGFCMLLRKHLQNARIIGFRQPGLERAVHMQLEHLNELGDLCTKEIVMELMGKHSNIIFLNDENMILDSIKHISGAVSSVREVLPGRRYFLPDTQDKLDALHVSQEDFLSAIRQKPMPVYKAVYTTFSGISPFLAQELCTRAADRAALTAARSNSSQDADTTFALFDADTPVSALSETELQALRDVFFEMTDAIAKGTFTPVILYENGVPKEYSVLPAATNDTPKGQDAAPAASYANTAQKTFPSVSALLESYYAEKNAVTRIRQKSADLRKIVQTALERNIRKYDLQCRQMKDTEKKDKYKVYGELINTYGYQVPAGAGSMEALNYYTNETITIPLNPTIPPLENAKKYFDKYNKLKRTYEALSTLTVEVKSEIEHLESVMTALDIALCEEDLVQIKEELIESGYIRRKGNAKKVRITSKPFHYVSSDGFHIYVGKNNLQNDELTFKFATGGDWWFHAKGIPGSHVVLKTEGKELPDRAYEESARLAAYYSKGRGQEKVEIDYLERKNVKKPAGAKPGFVVYYTNYSMMIDADISALQLIT